jgi:hypothetical protein
MLAQDFPNDPRSSCSRYPTHTRSRCLHAGLLAIEVERLLHPVKFHAKYVSVGESGDEYFQVSFDNEAPSDDDFDLSGPDHPYLIVQRQFEDDDGGVCYIETHDHDTYTGHFRLRLIEFTPTRLAFEIARRDHRYVEVTYDLDAKRFGDVQRIVRIVFGVQS